MGNKNYFSGKIVFAAPPSPFQIFYSANLSLPFVGLSILQNGKIPTFVTEELLNELFDAQSPQPCTHNLRSRLSKLGIFQVTKYGQIAVQSINVQCKSNWLHV